MDDVQVLLPGRVQHARATIKNALRAEVGTLIDLAPTGIPTPGIFELVLPAVSKTWVSTLIRTLPTRPKGALDHGNH